MKLFLIPILTFLLATQCFGKWLVVLEYRMNREYIARNLCKNRSRPQMQCKGTCVLAEKLTAGEKDSAAPEGTAKIRLAEVVYDSNEILQDYPEWAQAPRSYGDHYLLKKYTIPAPAIFHPPSVTF